MSKNTKSVEEMSLEEVRDEVAKLTGWSHEGNGEWFNPTADIRRVWPGSRYGDHPVPESLDTVAALMPGTWRLSIESDYTETWYCKATRRASNDFQASGDTELLARFRLLLLILRKESNG